LQFTIKPNVFNLFLYEHYISEQRLILQENQSH